MRQWQEFERPADGDWGALAQQVASEHVGEVQQAELCAEGECEQHSGEGDDRCESPAHGIGCNACDDCTIRETLAAAWPVIEAAIRSGDFDGPPPLKAVPAGD